MVYLRSLDDQIQIRIEEGQNLLIGRLLKCDMVLEDGSVSSQHARLQLQDNQLRVFDMGSTNGTRVNYATAEGPTLLLDGDTVEFGNVTFTVDGPQLESPSGEPTSMPAIVNLDPLEASQQLSDTMLSIPLPSGEELDDMLSEPQVATRSEHEDSQAEPGDEDVQLEPHELSFRITLALLLLSGMLLLAIVWMRPETL
jgi:pSer/pThr/pTyr-binding forkhead associated (FHA) protein